MKSSLRILNLEDNHDDAELNKSMLVARWPQLEFQRVDTKGDFVGVLDGGGIDLILSDHSMAGFSGREALALAQQKCPRVPFLFVCGNIGEEAAIDALRRGAADYVPKDRLNRLVPAITRSLLEKEQRAQEASAEAALRASERKYRQLFECLGDAVFLADEREGQIVDLNHGAEILLGCPRSEILRHRQSDFLPPLPLWEISLGESIETVLIRPDGVPLHVRINSMRLTVDNQPMELRLCQVLVKWHTAKLHRSPRLQSHGTLLKPFTIEGLLLAVHGIMVKARDRAGLAQATAHDDAAQLALLNFPRRILVVDGDNDVRHLMEEALTGAGYQVEMARDGAAGWVAVQSNNYDLIITDDEIGGPTSAGRDARLRSAPCPLPFILATKYMSIHTFDPPRPAIADATVYTGDFDDLRAEL